MMTVTKPTFLFDVSSDDDSLSITLASISNVPVAADLSISAANIGQNDIVSVEVGVKDAPDSTNTQSLAVTETVETSAQEASTSSDGTVQKIKCRKRLKMEATWVRNKAKLAAQGGRSFRDENTGRAYGRHRSVKEAMKCNERCYFSCKKNVDDDSRQKLHEIFWRLGAREKQILILKSTTKKGKKKNKKIITRKKNCFQYFLNVRGKTTRVCRDFFLCTYDIS